MLQSWLRRTSFRLINSDMEFRNSLCFRLIGSQVLSDFFFLRVFFSGSDDSLPK